MNSLRARLTVGAVVAVFIVVALCGGLLYGLIRHDRQADFDRNLLERARAQTALVEFDDEGLQFEWRHSEELSERGDVLPRYFQIRTREGKLLTASDALKDPDFAYPQPYDSSSPVFAEVVLGGDAPARAVTIEFRPKEDDEARVEPPLLLLTVAAPTQEMDETLESILMLIGLAGLVGAGVSILLLRLILWRELKPLDELAAGIAAVDESSLDRKIDVARAPAELLPVVAQLNELLARVQDTLRREKEFTAGAAHELRTPLAGIRGKLELALSRARTPEQHRDFARDSLEVAVSMQAIIDNLLTLARGGPNAEPEPMEIREVLQEAWRPYAALADQRKLVVDWELKGDNNITASRQAVQTIAANLFENAVNYSDERGRVEIAAEASADGFRLEVANTGCTLSPEQAERVTEPFWRADEVRTGGQTHAGLGLAICHRIAKAAGGELTIQVIKNRFVATLRMP